MLIKPEQLAQHLSQRLAALYVIAGDEHLLVQEATDHLRATARAQGFSEREVFTVGRSFDWSQVQLANQSLSLFGDRKIIELRLPTGKPGKEGSKALQEYIAHLNDDTLTLVTLPRLDRATRESAWASALMSAGNWVDITTVERSQLSQWIAARLTKQLQHTTPEALEFIANRVEGNLLAAHQEIQKLALLYPTGTLSTEQVHAAVLNVARYDVFKLGEAMLAGDSPRLLRMLEGLQGEGEAPVLVLWAITEEIRTLAKIQQGQRAGKTLPQLLRENRVWGNRERLIPTALQRCSPNKIRAALGHAALLDRTSKGLRSSQLHSDIWVELRQLVLKIGQ